MESYMNQVCPGVLCPPEVPASVLTVLEEINFNDMILLESIINKVFSYDTELEKKKECITTIELMLIAFRILRFHWVVTLAKYLIFYVYDFQSYSLLL
jgi:hypothetical protein